VFDYADKENTGVYARRLPAMSADPAQAMHAATEIIEAWWRLWGLMPPPQRPGEVRPERDRDGG
jgi:hypothetical protein